MLRAPESPLRRRARSAQMLAAALLAAGCGGGVFLGFEVGDGFDGAHPSVSLAADRASGPPGAAVQLVAAASDANGIDSVAFFRLDGNGTATQLGADGIAPFQLGTTIPIDAVGSVRFFARATDGVGLQADSDPVTVVVTEP